jgi:hypothetical protein
MMVCTRNSRCGLSGGVYPSAHAVERYREHFPVASVGDIRLAVGLGLLIENQTGRFLLGRNGGKDHADSRYVLPLHGRGLFILRRRSLGSWVVVTYARFEKSQQAFVSEHWLDRLDECEDVPMEAA